MKTTYLFDVDGTLTPAKTRIDFGFSNDLYDWLEGKEVYIVSGGSFERIIDQLGISIVDRAAGVFACMGNTFYQKFDSKQGGQYSEWKSVYENKFKAPRGFYEQLDKIVAESTYNGKTKRHYEERVGMVNFSIVGRAATQSQRKAYADYDAMEKEREQIVKTLSKRYKSLDFVIGGAVSIDIFNNGNDKAQIIEKHLKPTLETNKIAFVGDRIPAGGNDYALAEKLRQHPNGEAYEVESWQDTAKLLKTPPFTS
jgi:phosphomannomutase